MDLRLKNVTNPSVVWAEWLEILSFLQFVPDSDLRRLVGHCYLLGAPIEKDYWLTRHSTRRGRDSQDDEREASYRAKVSGLPTKFWCSEPDPEREKFSLPVAEGGKNYWVNADILRTQVEILNLCRLKLLDFDHFVEIGGGYGQLARAILAMKPTATYVIVDLPRVLDVAERWVRHVAPEVEIVRDIPARLDSVQPGGTLTLVPNTADLGGLAADVVINVNSFFEMTTEQVRYYVSEAMKIAPLIYSNNREIQIDNQELSVPVTKVIAEFAKLHTFGVEGSEDSSEVHSAKLVTVGSRLGLNWAGPEDLGGLSNESSPYQPAL